MLLIYVLCVWSLLIWLICVLGCFILDLSCLVLSEFLWLGWLISFPILGKFSTIISSSIFSWPFFLSSVSGTPMIQILGHLTLSQRSLRLSSFILILFFFFPLCFIYFLYASLRCKKWKENKSTIATGWSSNWLQRGCSREFWGEKNCLFVCLFLISEYMNHNFTFSKIKLYMAIIVIINVDTGTA